MLTSRVVTLLFFLAACCAPLRQSTMGDGHLVRPGVSLWPSWPSPSSCARDCTRTGGTVRRGDGWILPSRGRQRLASRVTAGLNPVVPSDGAALGLTLTVVPLLFFFSDRGRGRRHHLPLWGLQGRAIGLSPRDADSPAHLSPAS